MIQFRFLMILYVVILTTTLFYISRLLLIAFQYQYAVCFCFSKKNRFITDMRLRIKLPWSLQFFQKESFQKISDHLLAVCTVCFHMENYPAHKSHSYGSQTALVLLYAFKSVQMFHICSGIILQYTDRERFCSSVE